MHAGRPAEALISSRAHACVMLEKQFNRDLLYNKIVHFYMDRRRYDKEKANRIAQAVVNREAEKRTCRAEGCGHYMHDHVRDSEVCLVDGCPCRAFSRAR